jgi:hypothetical protein
VRGADSGYYTDSSALVKRHIPEIGPEWFQALVDQVVWNTITTTRVSILADFDVCLA